ncbi:MAG: acyltransferase [Pseudomonadota bacterium]
MTNVSRTRALKATVFPALDGLRAVAALSVFVHHIYQQFSDQWTGPIFGAVMSHLGPWGVSMFFVLSGFCIHWARLMDADRGRRFQLKAFATRRFFRIYPAFAVCVLLSFALGRWHSSHLIEAASDSSVIAHLSLVSSFFVQHRVAVNNVLWSVVVECHFYVVYGLLWRYFDRPRNTAMLTGVAVLVSVLTYGASVTLVPQGPTRVLLQSTFLASWWTWCLGALVAEWIHHAPPLLADGVRANRVVLLVSFLLSLLIGLLPHPFDIHGRRFVLPVIAAVFLMCLLRDEHDYRWASPMLTLGTMSYSLYLFHPVAIWLGLQLMTGALPAVAVMLVTGLALTALSYRFFEKPGMAMGKRLLAT